MRRALRSFACVAAASGAAAGHALASQVTPPPVSHLLVYAQEWSLWPSRGSLPSGTVIVQLWNRGQDSHDLRIRRVTGSGAMVGGVLGAVRATRSGQVATATWHLRAGHYELYCSMPGHMNMGMHARLAVTST
jgi:plastocyanin